MDPISALIVAVLAASFYVSKKGAAARDRVGAALGSDRAAQRLQEAQHAHERWILKKQHLHELRKAGQAGPTIPEAVADRIRKGPKARADMHGVRAWLFDLLADTVDRLTEERRAREERRRRGEQEWQKAARGLLAWWIRAGEQAARRWRERHAGQDPHRDWVTDWPDPNAYDPGEPVDAVIVDDPEPVQAEFVDDQPATPEPRQIEPGWPGDNPAPEPQLASTTPPKDPNELLNPGGRFCLGGCGTPTAWNNWCTPCLAAWRESGNPDLHDWAQRRRRNWEAPREPFSNSGQRLDPDNPIGPDPRPVYAVAERIHELPGTAPADQPTGGTPMGEIYNPTSAKADADFISTEMTSLVAHIDARIGELAGKDVEGIEAYQRMRDALAGVVPVADEASETFAGHIAKHDALHAGGKPGDGDYMELNR